MRGSTLIINLRSSPKSVRVRLATFLSALPHAVDIASARQTGHGPSRQR